MQWDVNQGRYTTILHDGIVAHAAKVQGGWELLVPALSIHEVVRNPRLETWISARPIMERVLIATLEWKDPHAR